MHIVVGLILMVVFFTPDLDAPLTLQDIQAIHAASQFNAGRPLEASFTETVRSGWPASDPQPPLDSLDIIQQHTIRLLTDGTALWQELRRPTGYRRELLWHDGEFIDRAIPNSYSLYEHPFLADAHNFGLLMQCADGGFGMAGSVMSQLQTATDVHITSDGDTVSCSFHRADSCDPPGTTIRIVYERGDVPRLIEHQVSLADPDDARKINVVWTSDFHDWVASDTGFVPSSVHIDTLVPLTALMKQHVAVQTSFATFRCWKAMPSSARALGRFLLRRQPKSETTATVCRTACTTPKCTWVTRCGSCRIEFHRRSRTAHGYTPMARRSTGSGCPFVG